MDVRICIPVLVAVLVACTPVRSPEAPVAKRTEAELACELKLSHRSVQSGVQEIEATFSVRSATEVPVRVTFNSGQSYDFRLRDSEGKELWRWSSGRMFAMVVIEKELGPDGWTFREKIPLHAEGSNLAPGRYQVVAELAASPTVKCEAGLEVR